MNSFLSLQFRKRVFHGLLIRDSCEALFLFKRMQRLFCQCLPENPLHNFLLAGLLVANADCETAGDVAAD